MLKLGVGNLSNFGANRKNRCDELEYSDYYLPCEIGTQTSYFVFQKPSFVRTQQKRHLFINKRLENVNALVFIKKMVHMIFTF